MDFDLRDPKTKRRAAIALAVIVVLLIIIVLGRALSSPGVADCNIDGACPAGQACMSDGSCAPCVLEWGGGCSVGSRGFQRYQGAWPADRYGSAPGGGALVPITPFAQISSESIDDCEEACHEEAKGCSGYTYDPASSSCVLWPPPEPFGLAGTLPGSGDDASSLTYGLPTDELILPPFCAIASAYKHGTDPPSDAVTYTPQPPETSSLVPPPGCWTGEAPAIEGYDLYTQMTADSESGWLTRGQSPKSLVECAQNCTDTQGCAMWTVEGEATAASIPAVAGRCTTYGVDATPYGAPVPSNKASPTYTGVNAALEVL